MSFVAVFIAEAVSFSGANAAGDRLGHNARAPAVAAASGSSPTTHLVPMFPSASDPTLQGFVRVSNHSLESGEVRVLAIDDTGVPHGPLTLSIEAGETAPFNSDDLEAGNAAKGLAGSTGAGQGDWYLELTSELDIEVLSYIRTVDGFLTAMHDLAPLGGEMHRIAIFNPGGNMAQVSRLRLLNRGAEEASVTIAGVDDRGRSPGSTVEVTVAPGAARTLTAAELEAGDAGITGALGDGAGKWRLTVTSAGSIHAMSLLASPTGHLTNLSTAPSLDADGLHAVSLFPSASDATLQGFVRVRNREDTEARVTIRAYDDTDWTYDLLTLTVAAGAVAPFNSEDLEQGNTAKGLTGSTGAGEGDWRLKLSSESDIEVLSYIRTTDGFLTAMHDEAPTERDVHRVVTFNPGSNDRQVSWLRIVNAGEESASVSITGVDDRGASPANEVRMTVPAGAARAYRAVDLESGGEGLQGALGDGAGKWRLQVKSDRPVRVLSLLSSPTGHLTNLSTAPAWGSVAARRAPLTSYELQKTGLYVDREAIRHANQANPDVHYVTAIAYGDFDGDRDEDVFMAGSDGSGKAFPVELYANDGMGQFTLANELIQGSVPEMVNARKALSGDFNGDGALDVFVAGHGYDAEPFPGESPVLLLSADGGLRAGEGLRDWVGFFHGAASADIDYDGDLDVVLTDFGAPLLLLNNGHGGFAEVVGALPSRGAYTTELIDVDRDGYMDLLLAGHEDSDPTEIYWGSRSHTYIDAEATILPAVPGQDTVVDIDAEDLDGDGISDVVVTRTGGGDSFYRGYYIQLVAGLGNRKFVDATENVAGAYSADGTGSSPEWITWVRLQDFDGDGHRDIVVDDAALGLVWINDGHGRFRMSDDATRARGFY